MDLDEARAIALRLPGTHEEPHFELTSFRVGRKIFATAPDSGDHLRIFVAEDETRASVAEAPEQFEELWWGRRLVGVKAMLAGADPERIAALLEESWRRRAPNRMVAAYDAGGEH